MTRLTALPGALLALALSLALTGCGGTVDFSIDQSLDINSTVNSGKATATYDLAAAAGSAWKQRKHISSIHVSQADATVTNVAGDNVAGTVSGEVWLLPDGATDKSAPGSVEVGNWTGEAVQVGNVISLTLSPELDQFVRNLFNGSGRFTVYAEGTGASGQLVHCTLRVVIGAHLKWKL